MKKGIFIFAVLIILVLLIGIAIPKLTVHDLNPAGPIAHIDQSDYGQWISVIDQQPILQWQEDGTTQKVYAIREIIKGQFAGNVLAMQTAENGHYYQVFFIAQPDGKRVTSFFDYPDASGLAMIPTDELPPELLWGNIFTTDDGHIKFGHGPKIILSDASVGTGSAVPGVTINGMAVIAQSINLGESGRYLTSFKKNTYHLQLPFGGLVYLRPILYGIQKDDGTVAVKWTVGDLKVSVYQDPQYAYPVWHCFTGQTLDKIERSLIETGKTEPGDPVYEIDPVGHESVYQCLYELTKPRYCSCTNGNCGVKEDPYPQSFNTFLVTHPFLLVRNQLGDLLPYQRSDVRQPDGKGCGDEG